MNTIRIVLSGPLLAVALLGGVAPTATQASERVPLTITVADDDMATNFAQLTTGMSLTEVMALMKREPNRKEASNYLGLEVQRLVWTQWSGSYFQVVLVGGRLVSKATEQKSIFG